MTEKLNKLQIRSKVLEIIKSYNSEDDFHSDFHLQNIKHLNSFNAEDFIIEILLKELVLLQGIELDAVKYIIMDFSSLEKIENNIWNFLKDSNISDKKKEIYLQLLRNLGGKIDTETLMDCFENFDEVVDNQTLELLELATVNPEAQIDFLDFLTSLNSTEQVQLIRSLQEDFNGDEIANVISPCLRMQLSDNVKSVAVSILKNSRSYFAIKPLKMFLESNINNDLKKDALKALNQLKDDGIEIENEEILSLREKEVCKNSVFYKAYLSQVDGCGNQGLIVSRIDNKKQVSMFSTVINSSCGIMDCFGLQNIPISDFQKVISRFKTNDLVVPVSAQQAKYFLTNAVNNNNETSNPLPYEYICWSVYISDIEDEDIDYESIKISDINDFSTEVYQKLYDTETFDNWFFEYDDNYDVQQLIDAVLDVNSEDIELAYQVIEQKINDIFYKVFTPDKVNEYVSMLKNAAFVFNLNYNKEIANILINLSESLDNNTRFLKDLIRRSVLQYLATIVANDENDNTSTVFTQNSSKKTISEADAFALLNGLEEKWDNENV